METRYKLLLAGNSGCGKTSLMMRYADGSYRNTFISTIGIDFKIRTVEKDGHKIKLHIWDTAGQERFQTITTSYYRGAQCILLVFSLTDKLTFTSLAKRWLSDINQHSSDEVLLVLVGAKGDDHENRCVGRDEIDAFCQKTPIKYFETSAKTGEGVNELFDAIVTDLLDKYPIRIAAPVPEIVLSSAPKPAKKSFCVI